MRLRKVILVFGFILFIVQSNAQLTGSHLIRDIQYSSALGKVTIIQDNNIIKLLDKHLYEESKNKGIVGSRIRIFSNSGPLARKEGDLIQANIMNLYPDIKTYYVFESPFYLLYIGDFRTRTEAMKFLKEEMDKIYPNQGFIVSSRINYPLLK